MVLAPGGEFHFLQANRWRERLTGTYGDGPIGQAYLTDKTVMLKPFFIDLTEVTNAQFKKFLDAPGTSPDSKTTSFFIGRMERTRRARVNSRLSGWTWRMQRPSRCGPAWRCRSKSSGRWRRKELAAVFIPGAMSTMCRGRTLWGVVPGGLDRIRMAPVLTAASRWKELTDSKEDDG